MAKFNKLSALVLASSSLFTASASAYEAGDFVLRAGAINVAPQSSSAAVSLFPDSTVTATDDTQFGISASYMFSENWGIEILAATPFEHDITGNSGALDGADIGSVKQLPPTISAQYFFLGNESALQPYLGLGLNYTTFFGSEVGADAADLAIDRISFDDSFGIAASAGVDYMINDNWGVNASAMYATISTTASLKTGGVTAATVDYNLDPMVYRLNVVYKF